MIPPTSIDGTDITGATIDGTDVTEITVDGDTVFTAGPDLPNTNDLLAFYDASQLSASDGDPITTWPDLSGNGHDLTAPSGKEPTFKTNQLNGNPILEHNNPANDEHFETSLPTTSQPFTYVVVARERDIPGGYLLGGSPSNRVDLGINGQTNLIFIFAGGNNPKRNIDTNFHIFYIEWNGGSTEWRIDGTDQGSVNPGTNVLERIKTAGFGGASSGQYKGELDIAEWIIYSDGLSNADRDTIESNLSTKYGISI